ncbi:RluA family pseudouridine synthase [Glaciimonas sp. PCH181]|uniref:RluA family pseudouridine synthase n=1 Tax=Glaciimonas sp. PCH181 TaxID=2133943 RepID=UPI000D348327|nr:RluA family pseudouridine synthase [Glaciimonas sp. PCH181]PUA18538.1 RNA pseudouridine synthase [Glaciimonas sp. PCH181]
MGLAVTSFTKPNLAENPTETEFEADIDDSEEIEVAVNSAAPIVLELTPEVCGTRLDKVISSQIPQYSRSRIQQWMEAGHVSVDGKVATTKMIAFGDETVIVLPQPAPDEHAYTPESMALAVVYEDDDIIVIDKPAGLVVHPAAGNWSGTLLNGLLFRWPELGGVPRAGIVHRLDKDTSGLMVVAKTLESQTDLVRQLAARTVQRQYLALVWGTPQLNGTIDAAMARHPRDRIKMAVSESLTAKTAVTHYERLQSGVLDGRPVSLMRCRLETGRTHQIRVHMLSIGFALVGDTLYGKQHLMPAFPRQALQATRLGLQHPSTGEHCEWFTPLPPDFADLITRAGISAPE